MLKNIASHITDCLQRAAAADEQARRATDPCIKIDYLEMADHWRNIARSYEFVETLERFLLDADRCRASLQPEEPRSEK
jgi:hypothetical protein